MAGIYQSVTELIGRTPLLEVKNLEKELNLQARVLVKLEYFNPAGSVKDRAALQMITEAEENGTLKQGSAIIEPTSGNTGIGLASIAASRGYRAIFVMPETMSIERRKLLKGYGAEIVLTEGAKGMKGAIAKAKELEQEIENAVILGQFVNTANPRAHEKTTGPEIWEDTQGQVDLFVAGVGTGGTITGTGAYLKSVNPSIEIVAVEPASSAVLSGENPGPHGLQGIGAGFVPDVLNTSVYDRISKVKEQEAYKASRLLAEKEGVLVGISSGAALSVALLEAGKEENRGKTIVALLPDTGERYLPHRFLTEKLDQNVKKTLVRQSIFIAEHRLKKKRKIVYTTKKKGKRSFSAMKEFKYVVTDAEGIHARPAGLLVKKAGEFTSSVTIAKGDKSADAKRIFGVMGLGVKTGEEGDNYC